MTSSIITKKHANRMTYYRFCHFVTLWLFRTDDYGLRIDLISVFVSKRNLHISIANYEQPFNWVFSSCVAIFFTQHMIIIYFKRNYIFYVRQGMEWNSNRSSLLLLANHKKFATKSIIIFIAFAMQTKSSCRLPPTHHVVEGFFQLCRLISLGKWNARLTA